MRASAVVTDWAQVLQPHLPAPIVSTEVRKLSSLWAGYGSVSSVRLTFKDASKQSLIVKEVRPPRASGIGHDRKVASYRVEASFYKDIAPDLINTTNLGIPAPVLVNADADEFTFVLTDLKPDFPVSGPGALSDTQVRAALRWLATYHAYFWEQPTPEGLQPQGSYWYLDTRREEFDAMGRQWQALKAVAERVDRRIKDPPSRDFLTCVHGDMKHENLMFSADGSRCAAYDFQYTGCSYGMRDVVYLFTSSVRSDQLARYEQDYLAHYRECLAKELTQLGRAEAAVRYDNAVMTKHLELAVLDYVRFMAGWGMWGSGLDWAVSRARVALPRVEQLLE